MNLAVLQRNTILAGRYVVVSLIGKGERSEVYLAIDQQFGSKVALKRILIRGDEAEKIEQEARILVNLNHPNLPKIFEHFNESRYKYVVMEYIGGDDLEKVVESKGVGFTLDWVLYWADQLLEALNYLHSQRPPIFHRDIKPRNLKLTAENNVMLVDIGLERVVRSEGDESKRRYEPVEQIRGSGINERSEIYSLSGTLYYLLTGQAPVDATTRADSILNNMPDPLKELHEVNSDVPEEISKVIMKGLSVAANLRYGSAREMQKVLREEYLRYKSGLGTKARAENKKAEEKVVMEESKEAKTLILQEKPTTEKTLLLEEQAIAAEEEKKEEARNAGLDDILLSKASKKTEILPEEIFPEVISGEGYVHKSGVESNEVTVPLIKLEESEKTSNYRVSFGDEEESLDTGNKLEHRELEHREDVRHQVSWTESAEYEATNWTRQETEKGVAAGIVSERIEDEIVSERVESERVAVNQEKRGSERKGLVIALSVLLVLFLGVVAVGLGVYIVRDKIFGGGKKNVVEENKMRPVIEDSKSKEEATERIRESQNEVSNVSVNMERNQSSEANTDSNVVRDEDTVTNSERAKNKTSVSDLERSSAKSGEENRRQKKNLEQTEKKPTPSKTPGRLDILQ